MRAGERMNKFFNNPEFIVDSMKEINLGELIGGLKGDNNVFKFLFI